MKKGELVWLIGLSSPLSLDQGHVLGFWEEHGQVLINYHGHPRIVEKHICWEDEYECLDHLNKQMQEVIEHLIGARVSNVNRQMEILQWRAKHNSQQNS